MIEFYVLLTVHPSMILVNKQLDAQFFKYGHLYSLYVSGSHVPIIRRITVSMRHLVYVTLCRWQSGMQEHMLLHTRQSSAQSDINQVSHWYSNSGMQEHMLLHTRQSSAQRGINQVSHWYNNAQSDINQVSHWYNNSPDDEHMAARKKCRD